MNTQTHTHTQRDILTSHVSAVETRRTLRKRMKDPEEEDEGS